MESNKHGGKRRGAGRKPGPQGPRQKTRELQRIAEEAAGKGAKPLDLLLQEMRRAYAAGDMDRAMKLAKWAAPYCHPKLKAIEHSGAQPVAIQLVEKLVIVDADGNPITAAA